MASSLRSCIARRSAPLSPAIDRQLTTYRATLDAGGAPAVVSAWITETQARELAAKASGDELGLAHIHLRLGRAYLGLRFFSDAEHHLRQALEHGIALDDLTGQGIAYQYLSLTFDLQGDFKQALHHSRIALGMFRSSGNQRGEAGTLNAVGWLHMRHGNYQRGLNVCREALDLNITAGFRAAEAETWDSMGYAHHHLGNFAQALECYQKALSIHREVGKDYYVADTSMHLGDTHYAVGNPESARDAWRSALAIFTDLDHPDAELAEQKLGSAGHELAF